MRIEREGGVVTVFTGETDFSSASVTDILLSCILEKLEEIRCGLIDVENEVNRSRR